MARKNNTTETIITDLIKRGQIITKKANDFSEFERKLIANILESIITPLRKADICSCKEQQEGVPFEP